MTMRRPVWRGAVQQVVRKPGVRSTDLFSASQKRPLDGTAGAGGDASRSSAAVAESMCIQDGLVSEEKESFDRRRQKSATASPAAASSVADQGPLTRNRRGREPQGELAGRATHEPGAILMILAFHHARSACVLMSLTPQWLRRQLILMWASLATVRRRPTKSGRP